MIQIEAISKAFGPQVVFSQATAFLQAKTRVGLVGPNGSGKTTLIRVLATALRPHAGSLTIAGIDALRRPGAARRWLGVVAHQTYLYGSLTARENLRFYARLYGLPDADARIAAVLGEVGLEARADEPVATLSRGMQQRASLARAILHEPRLLLLDEPETGLDETAQDILGRLITGWAAAGHSIVLASHRLEWAEALTDRVIKLDRGRQV